MEKQLPKNVRQIGNVSDTPKIYVEDYVDTFLSQLCDKAEEFPLGAFLIGETAKLDDQDCVFVHGAVKMQEIEMKGTEIILGEEVIKTGYEQCKEYFGEAEILGWFITIPGLPMGLNKELVHIHEKSFAKENSVLIMEDPVEKDEVFYAYKYKELMELGGHYIYYEKNPSMQNYMIATRKTIGVTPSEVVEDRAAKDFRSLVRDKVEKQEQKQSSRFIYAASTFLILVVLIIGVTTINNYDKMQSVQSSLDNISKSVSGSEKEPETKETNGEIVSSPPEDITSGQAAQEKEKKSSEKSTASEKKGKTSSDDRQAKTKTLREENGDGVYIVQKGDTLAIISKKAYGDTSHVEAICKMNGLQDGNLIFIGQKLLLP